MPLYVPAICCWSKHDLQGILRILHYPADAQHSNLPTGLLSLAVSCMLWMEHMHDIVDVSGMSWLDMHMASDWVGALNLLV